ncbi:MAG TPA: hypothetical protein VI248_13290 [Kineosporiaceae bacterium]
MVTPSGRQEDASPARAQPPIRWSRPHPVSVALVALWAVGAFIALFVPALLVSPGAETAPPRDVWTAFGFTVAGAIVMILASVVLWRRRDDAAVLIMGGIPAFATIVGGAILTASRLTGT